MSFDPEGDGPHVFLQIEKRAINTHDVVSDLAGMLGVARRDIGYAGKKDKHAVARQWFSVPWRVDRWPSVVQAFRGAWRVVAVTRHRKKLKPGSIACNRFVIVLRNLRGDDKELARRLQCVSRCGVPNYFGEQRFGTANLAHADGWIRQGRGPRHRETRGMWLSALRARIFNAVLSRRVAQGTWRMALPGEVFCLAGSRSFFVPEKLDSTLLQRMQEMDIHPSGALWGRGALLSRRTVARLEQQVATRYAPSCRFLETAGLVQQRRSLRLVPAGLRVERAPDPTAVTLEFSLPAGTYATAVLRELVTWQERETASQGAVLPFSMP